MKRIMSTLAAAGLALSAAACSTNDEEPPVNTSETVTSSSQGVLTIQSTNWTKGTTHPPTVTSYEVVPGETVVSERGVGILTVDEITDDEITVTLIGWYRGPSIDGENPTLTVTDGQTVTYETDSEDAGTNYRLTFESH